jgi:hypothetical protein
MKLKKEFEPKLELFFYQNNPGGELVSFFPATQFFFQIASLNYGV